MKTKLILSLAMMVCLMASSAPAQEALVKINFQPSGSVTPEGYLPDSGAVFGDRDNGFSYGWNVATIDTRDRNKDPDQRYDTLNHMQKSDDRIWEIALPNGNYDLFLVCGDPSNFDQTNTMDVEDTLLVDPDGQDYFDEYELSVFVSDGRLTIKPGPGASNAKVCFVDIYIFSGPVQVSVTDGSTIVFEQGSTSDTFDIVLKQQPSADVTVSIDPNTVDLNLGGGPGVKLDLTFTSDTWNTPQTVTVTAVDDGEIEGIEESWITFSVSSDDTNFDGFKYLALAVGIVDNDVAGILFNNTIGGGSVSVSEAGATSSDYEVMLLKQPAANVIVSPDLPGSSNGNISVAPDSLTFTPADWETPQSFTVTAVDDDILEGDPHSDSATHVVQSDDGDYDGLAADSVTVVINDNECGAWGFGPYDYNEDCIMNLGDFAVFATNWLNCSYPNAAGCTRYN